MEPSADLLVAERRLLAAAYAADLDALDALLDDRLVYIAPDGSPHSKAEHMAIFGSSEMEVWSMQEEAIDVAVEGTTGVTRVTVLIEGIASEAPFAVHLVSTRAWYHGKNGWRVLAMQANITESVDVIEPVVRILRS